MIQGLRRIIVILMTCGWAYGWNIAKPWRFFLWGAVSLKIFHDQSPKALENIYTTLAKHFL